MSSLFALLASAPLLIGASVALAAELETLAELSQARFPEPHRVVSGAISAEDVERVKAAGITHVVNLRPAHENPEFDEVREMELHGMKYHYLPISGPESLTKENAAEFDRTLAEIGDEPALIHCSSGNRVGAMVALREAWLRDRPVEAAITEGKRWGLTRLESTVREMLDE